MLIIADNFAINKHCKAFYLGASPKGDHNLVIYWEYSYMLWMVCVWKHWCHSNRYIQVIISVRISLWCLITSHFVWEENYILRCRSFAVGMSGFKQKQWHSFFANNIDNYYWEQNILSETIELHRVREENMLSICLHNVQYSMSHWSLPAINTLILDCLFKRKMFKVRCFWILFQN